MRSLPKVCLVAVALALTQAARADTISLVAGRDATLYEDVPGNSDGGGPAFFAGNTSGVASGRPPSPRRGLLFFDIAGSIPAGAVINSVVLNLTQSRSGPTDASDRTFTLHRLLVDWGEGTVGEGLPPAGSGAGFPTPPDGTSATWSDRFFDSVPWTEPGGGFGTDFVGTPSGLTAIPTGFNVPAAFLSTPALVSDVQGWLDSPATNFGWMLIGEEGAGVASSVRRFHSREATNPLFRPTLVIDFTPSGPPPDVIPEPAGLALLGLGALGLLGLARRRASA